MNYRHAFHAGNFADLVKHAALLALLTRMQAEATPVVVVDTHAGRGVYDLAGPEALKSGEAQAGVVRIVAEGDSPPVFEPLLAAVRALNPAGAVTRYPGSPWLIASALRPGDTYLACELRPEEQSALAQTLKGRAGVRTRLADGYQAAAAETPSSGRALVLIDPPFERPDDYANTVQAAARVRRRAPQAVVLIWLPLKDLETFDAFLRDLEDMEPGPLVVAETRMRPLDDPMKMNGCALVVANPPAGFEGALETISGWVAARLGQGGGARVYSL